MPKVSSATQRGLLGLLGLRPTENSVFAELISIQLTDLQVKYRGLQIRLRRFDSELGLHYLKAPQIKFCGVFCCGLKSESPETLDELPCLSLPAILHCPYIDGGMSCRLKEKRVDSGFSAGYLFLLSVVGLFLVESLYFYVACGGPGYPVFKGGWPWD
ncbi:hypothetical protein ACTACL_24645 [Pseudomonas syringae]|uniref:hypothetical protein n=1 Tax=Pseudomonas syringae TaxID=317 RepID=UPI003F7B07A8